MEAMREAWTDARLDDLNERVGDIGRRMDEGFNRVHEDVRSLRSETKSEFVAVRGEIGGLRAELRTEIGSLHRLILQVGGGMIAALLAGFLGLAAALS